MKAGDLFKLRKYLFIFMLLIAFKAYCDEKYEFPVISSSRIMFENGEKKTDLECDYFEIYIITDTPTQAPCIMFTLKPDAASDLMTANMWFSKDESSYTILSSDDQLHTIALFSQEFPNQSLSISDDSLNDLGAIWFHYYNEDYEQLALDTIVLSSQSIRKIRQIVTEQIRKLDFRKIEN